MTDETGRHLDAMGHLDRSPTAREEGENTLRLDEHRLRIAIDDLISEVTASQDAKEAIDSLEELVSQLRTANQNLVLATVKAQTMHEEAEALNRRQNEFLAMLAHELRNPLAPISNAATVLEKITAAHPLLPKVHGIIHRQVQHMARLLDDLLDASRVSSGKISLQKRPITFIEIIERTVEVSRPMIDKRRQQLTIEVQADPVIIDGDLVRLAQVFSNLLINASKFTPEEGLIGLSAQMQSGAMVVTVTDNGVGIAADIQPYIFDLFMQGPRSLARTEGGLGIGLTVARSLVEMHGGTISVRSDGLGCGASFEVSLPIHGVQEQETYIAASQMAAPGQCRILLIEDNVDASETLKMLLELEGHVVSAALDGFGGLAMAKANPYEVIICDIGLPGIDGFEVIAQLRQRVDYKIPPMIALSGYGQPEDRARAIEAGFNEYLVKPVEGHALLRAVAALTARASTAP